MKKLTILFLFIAGFAMESQAQQDPLYTQYMFNQLVLNPAYAGSKDRLAAMLLYRTQWVGFEGAPKTTTFSIHTPFLKQHMAVGATFVNDEIGIANNLYFTGYYAYRLKLNENTRLSLGMSAEIKRQQMSWSQANPLFDIDPTIPVGDPSRTLPNFGAGVYMDNDKYYLGFTVPRIIENKLDFTNGIGTIQSSAQQQRHFYLMGGFIMDVSKDVKFKPAALVKYTPNAPLEFDLNVSALFAERLWLGMTFRTGDSFDVIAQFVLDRMRIGYAYDYSLTKLQQFNSGSHEVMISIEIDKRSKGVHHPRYF